MVAVFRANAFEVQCDEESKSDINAHVPATLARDERTSTCQLGALPVEDFHTQQLGANQGRRPLPQAQYDAAS